MPSRGLTLWQAGKGAAVKVNAAFRLPARPMCEISNPRSETIGFTAKSDLGPFSLGDWVGSAGRSGKFPGRLFFALKLIFRSAGEALAFAGGTVKTRDPMSLDQPDKPAAPREPLLFLHTSIVATIAVCATLFVLQRYVLSDGANAAMTYYLAFIPARIAMAGQGFLFVSTALTCSLLHASFAHLAVNMVWLAAFGAPLAQRIGALRFGAFWAFTALCATALHFATHIGDASPLVGASGVVSGAMGAAARFGFVTEDKAGPRAFAGAPLPLGLALRSRSVITFLLVWALINYVSGAGMAPVGGSGGQIAWEAHVGGFLAGFLGLKLFDIPTAVRS